MRSWLRSELSHRNLARAETWAAEVSYGQAPSVIYQETESGEHGNFLLPAYRRIQANEAWKKRLAKAYTGSRFVPRSNDRRRGELECANSSDALLMNIFCYPGVLRRRGVCSLLAIDPGMAPCFGYKPAIPLKNGKTDRSEIDLRIGALLVEAKLTEGNFQTARHDLVHRYRDLELVFDVSRLPASDTRFHSCQLIRGALAAYALGASFCVLCDRRREDFIEACFLVFSAVTRADLRCRLSVVTWQELAPALPVKLRSFLDHKYGITGE
jgi:hypothetical protein